MFLDERIKVIWRERQGESAVCAHAASPRRTWHRTCTEPGPGHEVAPHCCVLDLMHRHAERRNCGRRAVPALHHLTSESIVLVDLVLAQTQHASAGRALPWLPIRARHCTLSKPLQRGLASRLTTMRLALSCAWLARCRLVRLL